MPEALGDDQLGSGPMARDSATDGKRDFFVVTVVNDEQGGLHPRRDLVSRHLFHRHAESSLDSLFHSLPDVVCDSERGPEDPQELTRIGGRRDEHSSLDLEPVRECERRRRAAQ